MTFVNPVKYKYAMNIKLSTIEATPITGVFPHVEDMVVSSRQFEKLEEAVDSANKLVGEFTSTLNVGAGDDKYKMVSEINPKFSGKETLSKDWGSHEVAKLWIYDKIKHEIAGKKSQIVAVALTQLIEVPGEPVQLN